VHADGGRSEWVVWGEHESTPVLAAMIRSVLRPGDNIVPFQDVRLRWVSDDIRRGVL
jgi:hypothetical protein